MYVRTYIHTSEWQHKKYTHNILKIYVPIITCVTSTLIDIPSVRFKIFKVNHLEKGKENFNDIEFNHIIQSLTEKMTSSYNTFIESKGYDEIYLN